MAVARRHHMAGGVGFCRHPGAERGLDRREMAPRHMVGVAAEILGGELPVARHDPFMRRDDLDAALAPVDEGVDIPGHLAEIVEQRRRSRVECREEQPFVAVELRDRDEPPALTVELAVIGFLQIRHADQPPVIAVGPAVIGADETRGVAVRRGTDDCRDGGRHSETRAPCRRCRVPPAPGPRPYKS